MIPFAPRPIRFLRIHEHDGWRIKLYSIVLPPLISSPEDFAAGLELALGELPRPAVTQSRPGLAFAILNRGRGADYTVLAWWDRENELPLRVFVRAQGEKQWRTAGPTESVCVWDLQVIAFERDAYVATILASPPLGPADYLRRTVEFGTGMTPADVRADWTMRGDGA